MTITNLTFTAHLHVPMIFVPHLSYLNLVLWKYQYFGNSLCDAGSLSAVSLVLVSWNKSLISPLWVPLPLESVSGQWPNLVCLGPLEPGFLTTLRPGSSNF